METDTTLPATFDTSSLPMWARRYPQVVALAATDVAYRVSVHGARHADARAALIRAARVSDQFASTEPATSRREGRHNKAR